MRKETTSSRCSIEVDQDDLQEQLSEALFQQRYEDVLLLIDKIDESATSCFFNLTVLSVKAHCLQMLGRSSESLSVLNQALNETENDINKYKKKLAEEWGCSQEEIDEFFPKIEGQIRDGINEELIQPILFMRGFVEWSLNQREPAISDFQNAAKTTRIERIFIFKILEKKLGVKFFPIEIEPSTSDLFKTLILQDQYEKAIELLSDRKETYCDRIAVCYALMGQYEEAQKCFEMFRSTSDPEDYLPVPAILYYLNGDPETALKELKKWPDHDLHFDLLFNMPA